jgi:hypothetical protein
MSKLKSYIYLIEYKNGDDEKMSKEMLEKSVDNIFDNVSKIVKQYSLQDNQKKKINMTLFTDEHNISASDYVKHYRSMSKEEWGQNFLADFDIEMIYMFN